MTVKIYDANEVTINFAGIPIDSGYDDGEFCRIEQENDDFTDKAGTDGEVARSKTNDRRTTITIILMQTSSGNAKLSAISNIDREAGNGAGVAPILVRDRQGLSVFSDDSAWISKPPDVVYDREPTARAWTLRAGNPDRFDGGN
jgi:hypothetical protein